MYQRGDIGQPFCLLGYQMHCSLRRNFGNKMAAHMVLHPQCSLVYPGLQVEVRQNVKKITYFPDSLIRAIDKRILFLKKITTSRRINAKIRQMIIKANHAFCMDSSSSVKTSPVAQISSGSAPRRYAQRSQQKYAPGEEERYQLWKRLEHGLRSSGVYNVRTNSE